MSARKILITDPLDESAVAILRGEGFAVDYRPGLKPAEIGAALADADALVVRSRTQVTADLLDGARKLAVVGRAGAGVDNIDVTAATRRGILVMNTPGGNTISTAEHAFSLLLALARNIPQANESLRAGKWERKAFMGVELFEKTLGIVGLGKVGRELAVRARAFGMRVVAYDPFLSPERAVELGVERLGLDELFARADFITLHTPLTDATRNIIDKRAIAKMKRGVRIINCARGGLIVEADLAAALDDGQVAGAAIDVFVEEPATQNPLFGRANLVATPHLGAATSEAQENVALQIAEQMADFLLEGAVANAVNMPSLTAEEAARLKPYLVLAEQIGSFAGQLTETGIRAVAIEYEGAIAELNTRPLTAAALTGLLAPQLATVNMVNAPLICRQRDIRVSETRHAAAGDYQTLMRVRVTTERRERSVAGTVFAGNKPRLVDVEGIALEAELGHHVLFVRNCDKPGFIGALGNALAAAAVNIATFHLGRVAPGADAIALVEVDQELTAPLLETVRRLPKVIQANAMRF